MSRKNGGIIGPANTPVGGFVAGVAGGVWRMNDVANFVSNSQWPKTPENIDNSCLFDGSGYGQRSISTAGSGTTATFSAWVKASAEPDKAIFTSYIDSNNYVEIYFSSGQFRVYHYDGGSTSNDVKTNAYFRDQSAWYNFHVIFDTTNGTEADRIKIYVNGAEVTSFATSNYPTSSQDLELSSTSVTFNLGARNGDEQWNGYMAEVVFIDGQALTPSSFGETNTATGIWTPKKIGQIASSGTNSFYLNFKDSSDLGNDASGLNNDFTVSGLASTDQMTDTCVENFSTLNPLHKGSELSAVTFSEGNLKHQGTSSGASYPYSFSTIGASQGKWYAEFKRVSGDTMIGIASGIADSFFGGTGSAKGYGMYPTGQVFESGSGSSYGSALNNNDIVGVAMDLDNNKLYFSINGTFQNSGVPTSGSTGTGAVSITAPADNGTGVYHFACGKAGNTVTNINANFGNPMESISSGNSDANGFGNFEYAVPSGYFALNTTNLNTYG